MDFLRNIIYTALYIIISLLMFISAAVNIIAIPSVYSSPFLSKQNVEVCMDIKSDKYKLTDIEFYFISKSEKSYKNSVVEYQYLTDEYSNFCKKIPLNNKLKELRLDLGREPAIYSIRNLVVGGDAVQLDSSKLHLSSDLKIVGSAQSELTFESIGGDPFFEILADFSNKDLNYKFYNENRILNELYYYAACYKTNLLPVTIACVGILLLISLFKCKKSFFIRVLSIVYAVFVVYFLILYHEALDIYRGDGFNALYRIFISTVPISSAIAIFVFFSAVFKKWYLKLIPQVLGLLLICVVLADIFAYKQFNVHITISDILKFKSDAFDSFHIIKDFVCENKKIVLLFVFIFTLYVRTSLKNFDNKCHATAVLTVFYAALLFLPPPQITLWDNVFSNIFQNGQSSINAEAKYSQDYKFLSYKPKIETHDGLNLRKNVIVLFVESLSANESKIYSGGDNDYLPNLDSIAKKNIYFKNYYSNGYNTDTGNFAFLTSVPHLHGKSMRSTDYYDNSFIKNFNENGYKTNIFYSANNIGYLRDIWLNSGFLREYDGNLSAYDKTERLVFRSVPDLDMFKELINHLDEWEREMPFFTMVMTTTSHHPYELPTTREKDFHKVIAYVDESINYLYEELLRRDFFKNGILVITGDHRAMNPYTREELSKFGEIGIAKVPLVIVGANDELSSLDKEIPLSHASLGNLIEYLCLPKVSYYTFNYQPYIDGSRPSAAATPIFYQVHEPADKVLFLLNNKERTLYLNGDSTYIDESELSQEQKDEILKIVAWLRK